MLHKVFDVVSATCVICSLLHSFLPPWDGYQDFPRFQKYYKAFIYTVGYIAVNARSAVYPSLSTQNGTKVSDVANKQ